MRTELQKAIEKWDRDVEAKAVRYIEMGYEPGEAMRMAKSAVERERRDAKPPARMTK